VPFLKKILTGLCIAFLANKDAYIYIKGGGCDQGVLFGMTDYRIEPYRTALDRVEL